jgi:hypothetical protein
MGNFRVTFMEFVVIVNAFILTLFWNRSDFLI